MDEDCQMIAGIIDRVQSEERYQFKIEDIAECGILTRRKMELNGQSEDYLYLLFENELHDYVTRLRINAIWRDELCVTSAFAIPV